ncbi:hypothetical protein NHF46_14075 [Arthrobacter alpinus]|nr:hypothetical protein [Arthrobacter alpinus]
MTVAVSALLGLAACSDPGASTAQIPVSTSGTKTFNLTPDQDRVAVTQDPAAAALVPEAIKKMESSPLP